MTSKRGVEILEKYGFAPNIENPKDFSPQSFEGETLVVYAAISMTDAFEEMAQDLKELTGAEIRNLRPLASSGDLVQLIENGAVGGRRSGADVYASANLKHMEGLKEKGFVEDFYRIYRETRLWLLCQKINRRIFMVKLFKGIICINSMAAIIL